MLVFRMMYEGYGGCIVFFCLLWSVLCCMISFGWVMVLLVVCRLG